MTGALTGDDEEPNLRIGSAPGGRVVRLIYECANETLKEILVGGTDLSLDQLRERHVVNRPLEVRHWDFASHRIVYREVERDILDADFRTFLNGYACSIEKGGWRALIDRNTYLNK